MRWCGWASVTLGCFTLMLGSAGCAGAACEDDLACGLHERCDKRSGRCVRVDAGVAYPVDGGPEPDVWACARSTDCDDLRQPICDALDHDCRRCKRHDECGAREAATPFCHPMRGTCEACLNSATDCAGVTPVCDATSLSCRACADDVDCSAISSEAPVCAPDGACVQCTTDTHCTEPTPICDAENRTCRACLAHAECNEPSGVCDYYTGVCLQDSEVVYVDNGVACDDGGYCERSLPCCTVQAAVGKATIGRHAVLVANGSYGRVVVSGTIYTWIIGGGSAVQIADPFQSSQVEVSDQAYVILENVLLGSTEGTWGFGVECLAVPPDTPTMELRRNVIRGNASGGITADGCNFRIYNNVITDNGSASATFGGVRLIDTLSTGQFWHNTVFNNQASAGRAGGIECDLPVEIRSSIVVGNSQQELSASCVPFYSLVEDGSGDGSGAHNIVGLPTFAGSGDAHLAPGSQGIDAADPATPLCRDLDGEPRCLGPCPDMGADEAE